MNDELALPPELAVKITALYRRMEKAYDLVARQLDFSCAGCPDNCCDSYFLHHTMIEWAWLRQGLRELPPARQQIIRERAAAYRREADKSLAAGRQPAVMCPLNEEGRCILYAHRLMICRLHGVPSSLSFPNGRVQRFPGCFRCQELVAGRKGVPTVERASLLRELAALERELAAGQGWAPAERPKVKKTIADMILAACPPGKPGSRPGPGAGG